MDIRIVGIGFVLLSVALLSTAQFIIKSRLNVHGNVPLSPNDLLVYVWVLLQDWRMWVGGVSLVLASLSWYIAVSRLPLSVAFPIAALAYPIVFLGSVVILREPFSWTAMAGNLLLVIGIVMITGPKLA